MTKFCSQCGAQLNEKQRFCNKCGAKLAETQPAGAPPQYQEQQSSFGQPQQQPYQAPYHQPYQPGSAAPATGSEIKPNIAGMLCYPLSFISGLLFLILTPYNKDRSVRFHAYQAIFFGLALFALNVILGIFYFVLPNSLVSLLSMGLRLLALGGTGWLMYQAYLGNQFKLPIVGDLAETQANKP